MDIAAFLKTVITTDAGYLCTLVGGNGVDMHEVWFEWPQDFEKIIEFAKKKKDKTNVYFTAHLYREKKSTKEFVLPSRTIQADLDHGIPPTHRQPSVLVQTSPTRHQGYWIVKETLQPDVLEGFSRALTYSIPYADRSGWSLGHKMRLPDTLNYKYPVAQQVHVVQSTLATYSFEREFEPDKIPVTVNAPWKPEPIEEDVKELWHRIRKLVTKRARDEYDKVSSNRSDSLYHLMVVCFRLGLTRDEVFWVAKESANNKWADNRYHADEDLAKDVGRAEEDVQTGDIDGMSDKERIASIRQAGGQIEVRHKGIAEFVYDRLAQFGTFISTTDGQDWYTTEEEGRPTLLGRHNDHFNGILESRFGLNGVEQVQKYTVNYLISRSRMNPVQGITGILSHYDADAGRVMLHTGRRAVLHIDANGVTEARNGDLGIVFPWRPNEVPFNPDMHRPLSIARLFDGCFDNLIEMTHEEAVAIMRSWFIFLLMRTDAISRPLLALFGQPGSGKSTLFRRMYSFLYGKDKAINSITTPEDFDHITSTDPFVVFDNLDSYERWLPDRLALSAALSVVNKRKLYTDNEDVYLTRGALVGISAHNPQFRREDIVDRLLMLNFRRFEKSEWIPDSRIMARVTRERNRMWGGLVEDVQKTLATPEPSTKEIPPFRVNDFARIGLWAARALDYEEDFVRALGTNAVEQVSFNLEEEDLLVDTIKRWLGRRDTLSDEWYTATELYARWRVATRDSTNFEKSYRSALKLGRKLWALHATLKSVFNIEFKYEEGGTRLWRIQKTT